jgi:hypothetical protein
VLATLRRDGRRVDRPQSSDALAGQHAICVV